MSDERGLDVVLASARPQVVAALLRYFRDVDRAEDAYQEACVRALATWRRAEPPRDPVAWLVLAGRNAALDAVRRQNRERPLPAEPQLGVTGDTETTLAEALDDAGYRDDVLRLLFICCHPELPPAHQIALALRVVSGLSIREIARAFLVGESAMEQRLTRAKSKIAAAEVPFGAPGGPERAERLQAVASMVYLLFNEGYSATGGDPHIRGSLCEEAIRLARLLLALFPDEPTALGLTALLLLQHARAPARLDDRGEIVLLDEQDRTRWRRDLIDEGLGLVDAAIARGHRDVYVVQAAIAAEHARAARAADTDWARIDALYGALEALQPSPVVTLNRAVAIDKIRGPAAALSSIEPLSEALAGYFNYFGVRGALLERLGRIDEAREALERALALARTPAEAAQIRIRLGALRYP